MLQAEAAFACKDFLRAASFYAKVIICLFLILCICIKFTMSLLNIAVFLISLLVFYW